MHSNSFYIASQVELNMLQMQHTTIKLTYVNLNGIYIIKIVKRVVTLHSNFILVYIYNK